MAKLRVPHLDRWATVGLVLVIAGLTAIILGLLANTSNNGAAPPTSHKAIDPINPLDEQGKAKDFGKSLENLSDPFATGFGANVKHKVTVRVSANGPGGLAVRFRHGKRTITGFSGSYSVTRTFKSRFPTAQVAFQIFKGSSRGTCTITVDGVVVDRNSTTNLYGIGEPNTVTICVG
jgi:hypothetical protein